MSLSRPLLEKIKQITLSEIAGDDLKIHIDVRATPPEYRFITISEDDPNNLNLLKVVKEKFIGNNQYGVLLLIGNSGSGKSYFTRSLIMELWEKYLSPDDTSPPTSFLEEGTIESERIKRDDIARTITPSENPKLTLTSDQSVQFSTRSPTMSKEDKLSSRVTPIPLWVPLLAIENPATNLLKKCFDYLKLTQEEINELDKSKTPILLILDGYDEIYTSVNLYHINHLERLPIQIIITCRRENLAQDSIVYRNCFTPSETSGKKLLEYYFLPFNIKQIKEYVRGYIGIKIKEEKDREKIGEHKIHDWDADYYIKVLESIPDLIQLISNPYVLSITVRALPTIIDKYIEIKSIPLQKKEDLDLESGLSREKERKELLEELQDSSDHKKERQYKKIETTEEQYNPEIMIACDQAKRIQITRQTLYQISLDEWFKHQANKLREQPEIATDLYSLETEAKCSIEVIFKEYTENLAKALFKRRQNYIEVASLTKSKLSLSSLGADIERKNLPFDQELLEEFFDESYNPHLKLIKKGYPLKLISPTRHTFWHKSLIEFFAASHLFNGIVRQGWIATGRDLNAGSLLPKPSVIQFLADRVKMDSNFKDLLLEIVEISKYEPDTWKAAANAMTILNVARVNFNRMDFRGIRIGGINLDKKNEGQQEAWGADLTGGTFDETDFREADLRYVNFTQAWLREAKLDGSCLDHIRTGGLPLMQGSLHRYSPNRRWLVIVTYKTLSSNIISTITIHDMETSSKKRELYVPDIVTCLCVNDIWLAVGIKNTIQGWNLLDTRQSYLLSHSGLTTDITCVAFHPHSHNILAAGSSGKSLLFWHIPIKQLLLVRKEHTERITDIAFSADGQLLISSSTDHTVRIWKTMGTRVLCTLGIDSPVTCVAFSSKEKIFAYGTESDGIEIMEISSDNSIINKIRTLSGSNGSISTMAFSVNGKLLAAAKSDYTIWLWDVYSGEVLNVIKGHTKIIRSLFFLQEDNILTSSSFDGTLRQWEVLKSSLIPTSDAHTAEISSISFSKKEHKFVSASLDKSVLLWDATTGYVMNIFNTKTAYDIGIFAQEHKCTAVSFSPIQDQIAIGLYWQSNFFTQHESAHICDMDISGRRAPRFASAHNGIISSVVFSPDGDKIVSGSIDSTIQVIEASTNHKLCTLRNNKRKGVTCLAFSPHDKTQLIAGEEDGVLRLWDAKTCTELGSFQGKGGDVTSVAFSPYHRDLLASGDVDGMLHLWNIKTRRYDILKDDMNYIYSVAFSPHWKGLLASGSRDKALRLWDVDHKKMLISIQHPAEVYSLTWAYTGNYIVTGDSVGAIRLWNIEKSEDTLPKVMLLWQRGNFGLFSYALSINRATGLSRLQHQFFSQCSEVGYEKPKSSIRGELSRRKSVDILAKRNSQEYVSGGEIKDVPLGENCQFTLTPTSWLVSIVRKKPNKEKKEADRKGLANEPSRHVFLLIQGIEKPKKGIDSYYSVIKVIHFLWDRDKPRSLISGKALIEIRDQSPANLRVMAPQMIARSYDISKENAEKLLRNIEVDSSKDIDYHLLGSSSLFSSHKDSCLTWCESQLAKIGIPMKEQDWSDLFCAFPEKHLPENKDDPKKVTSCVLM